MALGDYEGMVGWRYLLRQRRRPHVLIIGGLILAIGAGLLFIGTKMLLSSGAEVSVFSNNPSVGRIFMGVGGALSALGACLSLFGAFNTFLTVFSAFSAFMITIGVAEVILVLGVMNGFQGDLRSKIIDTYAHVMIEPEQHGTYLKDYRHLSKIAREVDGVEGATPLLQTEVMVVGPTNLSPVLLTGIDIDSIGQANQLPTQMVNGKLEHLIAPKGLDAPTGRPGTKPAPNVLPEPDEDAPEPADVPDDMKIPAPAPPRPLPGLVTGIELRRNLALWPGEQLNVISPLGELGPNGPQPKSRPFRLAGWYESGMLEFDSKLAYATLRDVQRLIGVPDVAGAVQVRVTDLEGARVVRDKLRTKLRSGLRISDWQERNSNLFSALKLEKIAMFLVLSINILLAAFSIIGTLVMTIVERKREISILMAMGSTRRSIIQIFISQGAFTGVLGSVVGAVIGLSGAFALYNLSLPLDRSVYYISEIPVDVRFFDVVAIVLVALLVSLISTIYPAWYASNLRPVEGLSGG